MSSNRQFSRVQHAAINSGTFILQDSGNDVNAFDKTQIDLVRVEGGLD